MMNEVVEKRSHAEACLAVRIVEPNWEPRTEPFDSRAPYAEKLIAHALRSLDANALSRVLGGITEPEHSDARVVDLLTHLNALNARAEKAETERDAAIRERDSTSTSLASVRAELKLAAGREGSLVTQFQTVTKERDEARENYASESAALSLAIRRAHNAEPPPYQPPGREAGK